MSAHAGGDLGRELEVTADLQLEVDGQQARVTASGSAVTVTADDALALLRAMSGAELPAAAPGRRALAGGILHQLDESGLHVDVRDARGSVLTAGRGVDSWSSGLVLGDRHVALGAGLRRRLVRRGVSGLVVLAVSGAVVTAALRRWPRT